MIDSNFTFLQPITTNEALEMYDKHKNKSLMYGGGLTEYISRARVGEISPEVIIDIKSIPDCNVYEERDGKLLIGAAIPLNTIIDEGDFPLLASICRSIATRTARNKISIGGNLLSNLPYKEAVLAFLLADSEVIIASEEGSKRKSIHELYPMKAGEFLVQIITDIKKAKAPYRTIKKTKQSNVNYPIVTLASLLIEKKHRFAISGLCDHPFYMEKLDAKSMIGSSPEEEKNILNKHIQGTVLDDLHAKKDFRIFLFHVTFQQLLADVVGE